MENYNILKSKLNLLRGKYFNFEIIQNNREKENKREKMRYIYKYIYYIYIEREINESDLKKKYIWEIRAVKERENDVRGVIEIDISRKKN